MNGGEVVRRARRRARVSQAELARRMGTKQPVIARWESGAQAPTLASVARAVGAAGFLLDVALGEVDPGDDALLQEWKSLTPAQRLRRNEAMLATEEWVRRARPVTETG